MKVTQRKYMPNHGRLKANRYDLGSIPREESSLRKIRLIHVAKATSPSILACSSNCWRNSSVSRIWYCCDLFSFLIDIVITSNYYIQCNYSINAITKTNKALIVVPTQKEPLTNHLNKDKTMANPNYTPNPARSVSITTANTTNYRKFKANHRLTERGNSVVFKALLISTLTAGVTQAVFFYLKFLSHNRMGLLGLFYSSEFAVRATPRNKAEYIRTNKGGYSILAVEPLSHPFKGDNPLLTKISRQIAMIFKFLLLGKKRLNISIRANSEAEARQRLQFTSPAILVARMATNRNGGQA